MTDPLLSIVIANYNYGRFLEEAIQSVALQEVSEKVELIICDAASTDSSVEIIKKYANGLPPNTPFSGWISSHPSAPSSHPLITWWCSEKDGGQSNAFNKGFRHANGEWLSWLNSDDLLLPGTVKRFLDFVALHSRAEWITGNMVSFDDDSGRIRHVAWGPRFQPFFFRKNHAPHTVFGPTSFFKRALYERMGDIDESLHYAMDVDYWARLTMAGVRQCRLNHLCWAFRIHDDSKTAGKQENREEARDRECHKWHAQNGYTYLYSIKNFWYLLWLLCRVIDGSLIYRIYYNHEHCGKSLRLMYWG